MASVGNGAEQWHTEGNPTLSAERCQFRSHPLYKISKQRNDVQKMARWLTVAAGSGVKRVFYYCDHFPGQQDSINGISWTMYNPDSSVTPGAVARAVWASMLDGSKPLCLLVERDEEVYIFQDVDELVVTLAADTARNVEFPSRNLPPSARCRRFDVMGNETVVDLSKPCTVTLGPFMQYLRFRGVSLKEVIGYVREGLKLPPDVKVRAAGAVMNETDVDIQ
jgi:hypothetical protein